jgi:hypothetical protein
MFAERKRLWLLLILLALGFRLFVAFKLPNDTPDDGRVYAQIARNILEQHIYSHEEQVPFTPSLIRLPGYPLFLAAIYSVAGHTNNTAVRVVQAFIDTFTCILIAVLALLWTNDARRKNRAALIALALAAVCPFTTIYVATILTEVPTSLLAVTMVLLATLALKSTNRNKAIAYWFLTGLIAGVAVLFRPDNGLFAAAVGITILLSALNSTRDNGKFLKRFVKAIGSAAVFSFAFCLVLVPWTIRNRRVFGVFQPLSPAHGEMPGEFVPRGYLMWLRTWLDDGRYIGPVLWRLDTSQIPIEAFPKRAFDSAEERERVAELLGKYNHQGNQEQEQSVGAGAVVSPNSSQQAGSAPEPSPQSKASTESSPAVESTQLENGEENDDEPDEDVGSDEESDVEMTP